MARDIILNTHRRLKLECVAGLRTQENGLRGNPRLMCLFSRFYQIRYINVKSCGAPRLRDEIRGQINSRRENT